MIAYFFGGGFMHGTANDFNVDYFMDEDVVLVIVESRVGALGEHFLILPTLSYQVYNFVLHRIFKHW